MNLSVRKHEDMLKRGKVSIWVGNMNSEDELLCYVDDGSFGQDFGFIINPTFGRELKVEKHPASLATLARGFSAWRAFAEAVVQKGNQCQLASAKCMVVLYAFDYVPFPGLNKNAPLTYLGSFDFKAP